MRTVPLASFLTVLCLVVLAPSTEADPPARYRFPQGDAWGYLDDTGKVAIPARYRDATNFSDGLAAAKTDGDFGYLRSDGEWAIAPSFSEAGPFREGRALVTKPSGERGFINSSGANFCPLPPAASWALGYGGGLAAVQVEREEDAAWGFIGSDGALAIAPTYSWAESFSEGVAVVMVGGRAGLMGGGKWGFVDPKGAVVIPCDKDGAGRMSDGRAAVLVAGAWGYVDKAGRLVIECEYAAAWPFAEGLALVRTASVEGGLWGYIDRFGTRVIAPSFTAAGSMSGGLAAARDPTGQWGYIDAKGAWAIAPRFALAESFTGPLAQVVEAGHVAYIDRTGRVVWSAKTPPLTGR